MYKNWLARFLRSRSVNFETFIEGLLRGLPQRLILMDNAPLIK